MFRKALDMGISLHRGPVGEPGKDALARTFERKGSLSWTQRTLRI
jgi:hypothetical protein